MNAHWQGFAEGKLLNATRWLVAQQSLPGHDLHGLTDHDAIAAVVAKWLPTYLAEYDRQYSDQR